MRSVELTVAAGNESLRVFKAIKRFDPSAMMGPTLELLRSVRPLYIDMTECADYLESLRDLLRLLDDLDELQLSYELSISDRVERVDGNPTWIARAGSKSDIVAAIEEARRQREQVADVNTAVGGSSITPVRSTQLKAVSKLFHERWEQLGFDGLLQAERDHVLLWELHVEVSNGTFEQYLCNSSGDHASEAVAALQRVGPKAVLDILLQVLDVLPGGWCADREERSRRVDAVPNRFDVFRTLTDEYHDVVENAAEGSRLIERICDDYLNAGLLDAVPDEGTHDSD